MSPALIKEDMRVDMWATDGLSTYSAAQKCNRGTCVRICVRGDYSFSSHVSLQAAALGVGT